MNSFLQPFATVLKSLHTNGFQWFNQTLNQTIRSRVIAPIACLDAPAKASVQIVMQYNGENSCGSCEAKGESSEVGGGTNWVFPVDVDNSVLRSAERMQKQTEIVERYENLKHFKGVKGKSIVTNIPFFDRSIDFPPDYMHSVLLGVMLMFLTLWCNSSSHNEDYYLRKEQRDGIDAILESIAPPEDITRTPRKLNQLCDWKASELRAFILYYGPIVLKNRLNDAHYQHFLLLSRGIQILCSEEIDSTELDFADTLLNIFVIDVERLYEVNKCSYNVHQLKHLALFVKLWGPLWVWSAFSSEDQNGELIKMIHGSNKIDVELSNTIKIFQAYRSIKYLINPARHLKDTQCRAHGAPTYHTVSDSDLRVICTALHFTIDEFQESGFLIFKRCKIREDIFTSELYTRQVKRTNFHVQWKANQKEYFGIIKYFLKLQGNLYAVLRELIISQDSNQEIKNKELNFNFNHHIKHVRDSYCVHVVPINGIISKVLRVENYICTFINNVEKK